jgi:hypothetical protein
VLRCRRCWPVGGSPVLVLGRRGKAAGRCGRRGVGGRGRRVRAQGGAGGRRGCVLVLLMNRRPDMTSMARVKNKSVRLVGGRHS